MIDRRIIAICLVVAALLLILFVFRPFTSQPQGTCSASIQIGSSDSGSIITSNTSDKWANINQASSEKHCILQAKKVVRDAGYPDVAVFGCTCNPIESAEQKNYACKVNAIDGSHSVSITCKKSDGGCLVTSEVESKFYTFDQLEELIKVY